MIKSKVVLVPFPFDDLSSTKVRPAVCLTEPIGPHRHIVLAFITSQTPSEQLESDLILPIDQPEFSTTGLRVTSVLRLHRMMTVSASLIRRELGTLSPSTQTKISSKLRTLFGLQ